MLLSRDDFPVDIQHAHTVVFHLHGELGSVRGDETIRGQHGKGTNGGRPLTCLTSSK